MPRPAHNVLHVEQNNVACFTTAPREPNIKLGTTGCAMCVGIALWDANSKTALLAHIEPDELETVKRAITHVLRLMPSPTKAHCVTSGKGSATEQILSGLKQAYFGLKTHMDQLEIVINASTGAINTGNQIINSYTALGTQPEAAIHFEKLGDETRPYSPTAVSDTNTPSSSA